MASEQWFILSYVLPSEPSRKRVLAWRHLRKLGAIYLDTGIWFLPYLPALQPKIEAILTEIREMGGRCHSFIASGTDQAAGKDLHDIYARARRDEYADLLEKCERYLRHVERLVDAGDFEFAAVEELEEDLEKRRRWLAQIKERDAFGLEERISVEACLNRCEEALSGFVESAYLAGAGTRDSVREQGS